MTILGFSSWIFSQEKPKRLRTPGPKFSMMMWHFFRRSTNTCLPSALFMLTVIERLLQLSIVKYKLSAFGMSRSWPRVASPWGFSNLMTSAPIQARSCEHVGPAWTCVMSRMRTSFRASIGSPIPLRLFLFCARVQAGDATAFGAGALIDDGVDERGFARAEGFFHRLAQLGRGRGMDAHAAEGLHQLVIACTLDEHGGCHIRAAGRIDVRAALDAVVVEDDPADRQPVAADSRDFPAREAEGAATLHRTHRL